MFVAALAGVITSALTMVVLGVRRGSAAADCEMERTLSHSDDPTRTLVRGLIRCSEASRAR